MLSMWGERFKTCKVSNPETSRWRTVWPVGQRYFNIWQLVMIYRLRWCQYVLSKRNRIKMFLFFLCTGGILMADWLSSWWLPLLWNDESFSDIHTHASRKSIINNVLCIYVQRFWWGSRHEKIPLVLWYTDMCIFACMSGRERYMV